MTKAEIINQIAKKTGIDKSDVQETVEATIITSKTSMIRGENVFIRGFGSFVNKKRAKKIARNISTNTAIILDAHYKPSFKPAQDFCKKVRENNKVYE